MWWCVARILLQLLFRKPLADFIRNMIGGVSEDSDASGEEEKSQ
jgi:hypothetical protein